MIERKDLFSIPFYNKTQYTGSHLGMRYRIEKHVEDDSPTLLATWWPGPYCFTATPDEQKKTNTFEYSDEGIGQACDWLNQVYEENADLFKTVPI